MKLNMRTNIHNENGLPWHVVEPAVKQEVEWLQDAFDFGQRQRKDEVFSDQFPLSEYEMLRQISISILRGNLKAKELKSHEVNGLWTEANGKGWELEALEDNTERHGGYWHRAMMSIVKKHFLESGFDVENEPYLNQGRADLGVYKEGYQNLYVEIGTTSLTKTWLNLHTMPDSIFLFVPSVHYALEFQTN
ncbi:MAG: hypothetical protein WDZ93_00215 [Candidatus Paceibacterota bacterium]